MNALIIENIPKYATIKKTYEQFNHKVPDMTSIAKDKISEFKYLQYLFNNAPF